MWDMARILVTEEIADGGLDRLRSAGHSGRRAARLVGRRPAHGHRRRPRADHPQLHAGHRRGARGGRRLIVVGSAGIGLDNVDVERRHRPRRDGRQRPAESNIISAAEHTMALLLAQARNVPQAHAARRRPLGAQQVEGVELADKTLGIVGLGRIGKLVAERAGGFGMRLIAYDPFVSAERGPPDGRRAAAARPGRRREPTSSRSTCRRTTETTGLISRDLLLKAKPTPAGRSTSPAAASSTRRRWPRRCATGVDRPAPRSTCSAASRRPSRRCSSSTQIVDHAAPRRQHPRGAGQGRRHDRRHGAARPRRRVRAVRRQPQRRRGQRDAAPVPAARPSAWAASSRSLVGAGCRRRSRSRVEGEIGGYDTRILGLSALKGFFGAGQRRAGHVRQRPAAGRCPRASRSARSPDHVGRLREPAGRSAVAAHGSPARSAVAAASSASC